MKVQTGYIYHIKDEFFDKINAFPTLEKYIDHPHTINGSPVRVADNLKDEILEILIHY